MPSTEAVEAPHLGTSFRRGRVGPHFPHRPGGPASEPDWTPDRSGQINLRRAVIFHLIFSLPCLLVLVRFLLPLTLAPWLKGAVAVLLLVGSQYHLWCRLSSGSVFSPEFPRPFVILLTWAFGAILFLAPFTVLLDVGTLVATLAWHAPVAVPDGARYATAALASLLSAAGLRAALSSPPLKDLTVCIPDLPPQFDGYRLLHLTDLHISRLFPAAWTRRLVERSNALGADLIVVTGDFIDGTVAARRGDVAPLRDLRAPDGVYAIPGNHEYIFDYREWVDHLSGLGMRMLLNRHVILARGQGRITLAGVTDASARRTGDPGPDLAAALAGAPTGAPVLLLDHQPRMAREAAARGVSLQLSGHTHGGMIRGLDRLVARGNAGFVSGRYDVGGMTLYVNNGTALWPGFALRLGRPSELTRITLRRAG